MPATSAAKTAAILRSAGCNSTASSPSRGKSCSTHFAVACVIDFTRSHSPFLRAEFHGVRAFDPQAICKHRERGATTPSLNARQGQPAAVNKNYACRQTPLNCHTPCSALVSSTTKRSFSQAIVLGRFLLPNGRFSWATSFKPPRHNLKLSSPR